MAEPVGRGRRDNIFLVAAVALPVVVVGLFLVASAIPRWTIPLPEYDLVLRSDGVYSAAVSGVATVIRVRDGQVVAEYQPAAPNSYPQKPALYVLDHRTRRATEVPLEVPAALDEGEKLRVTAVAALADRRVLDTTSAPDGYTFEHRYRRGPGIMGELFGMGRYNNTAAIVRNGRVIRSEMPTPYSYSVQPVGWLVPQEER